MTQRETYQEFIFRDVQKILTILMLIIVLFSLAVLIDGEIYLHGLELKYQTLNIPKYEGQNITVDDLVQMYFDSVEVPEELLKADTETIEIVTEQSAETELPYGINVDGITPTVATFNVSSYCACEKCCGKTDGITASGELAKEWCTIAAGKKYELGTVIYIPDLADMPNGGWFIVQDRGGAISDERLDIYLSTHQKALEFGRQYLECYVYEKED